MKASLARLGHPRRLSNSAGAATRLDALRAGAGGAVPPLMRAERRRERARLALIRTQPTEIQATRQARLAQTPAAERRTVGALTANSSAAACAASSGAPAAFNAA